MGILNLSSSLSGMAAAATRMAVSADNIARRNVPNAEKNRVIQTETAIGGVATSVEKVPLDGSGGSDEFYDSSNIDYAEEIVGMIVAKTAFKANVAAAESQLDLLGGLLDIKV